MLRLNNSKAILIQGLIALKGLRTTLTLFPMGVGHECFFEEQSIIMSLQTDICSCKLNDNSLSSIFKARIALVLHFVIEN